MKSSVGAGRHQDLLFQPCASAVGIQELPQMHQKTRVKPLSCSKRDFRMIVTFLKSLEFFRIENEGYCVCVISLIHKEPSHNEWGGIIIYHTEMFLICFLTILPFLFFTLFYVCLCRILMDAGHFFILMDDKVESGYKR